MSDPRQTQSYLRSLFARRGIAPQHRYGQNFLIDLNLHELIVKTAEVGPDDVVLEIGPGAGALTALMAARAAAVVAVEIDPVMAALTAEAVAGMPNVRVLNTDALASKSTLNPEVLDNVRAGLAVAPGAAAQARGQPSLQHRDPDRDQPARPSRALPEPDGGHDPARAGRADARRAPSRKPTAPCRSWSRPWPTATIVRTLPPTVFWPRPKVDSAIVLIAPEPEKRAAIADIPWFHQVVRQVFLHRRKNLRRVLYSLWRDRTTKPEVDALLESLGLTGLIRAEAMNVEEFLALAAKLREQLQPGSDPVTEAKTEETETDAE